MAFAQGALTKVVTIAPNRQNAVLVQWSSTGVTTSSEEAVIDVPENAIIVRFTATLTGGTGTTINPVIGRASGFTADTQDQVLAAPGAAAHIDVTGPFYYYSEKGTLYVKTAPDAGTDNAVSYELLIIPGWTS